MMRIVRWLVLGGAVVMLLPSDEKSQATLAKRAVETAHYASTTCERHADACAKGRTIWAELVKKAEFAGRVAWDIAFERKKPDVVAPQPSQEPSRPTTTAHTPSAPKRETRLLDGTPKTAPVRREPAKVETGALRPSDRQVPWQGARTP